MTGYGSAFNEFENFTIKVEIKSLNSKYFDLRLRIPNKYMVNEIELQKYLESKLIRGKIDLNMTVKFNNNSDVKRNINQSLFLAYFNEIKSINSKINLPTDNLLNTLLSLPDVLTMPVSDDQIPEEEWKNIMSVVDEAILAFNQFRSNEGLNLKKELLQYKSNISKIVETIDQSKDQRIEIIRQKLEEKIDLIQSENKDNTRLEQELIYYIDKLDITEEIERLRTHLAYYEQCMQEANNGKKLGFIAQEIGREINTIGSKANDSVIQHQVVLMKNELEKIKQQLSNIL